MANRASTLRVVFFSGALLGSSPLLLHLCAGRFVDVRNQEYVADIVMFGFAVCSSSFMTCLKVVSLGHAQKNYNTALFLTVLLVIEICLFVGGYMAVSLNPNQFQWEYLIASVLAVLMFSIAPYIVEVKIAAG